MDRNSLVSPYPPGICLRTLRLELRPVTPADRNDLLALEADPEVMRFLNGGLPVPVAGLPAADFLTPRGNEPEVLVAHERASDRFIGWFALFDEGCVGGLRTAEVGYRLRRDAWGQGFAVEGLDALVADAFGRLGCDRLRAQTMAVNLASCRVLDKAGFRHIDTLFPTTLRSIPGGEHGEKVYERRRDAEPGTAAPAPPP